MMEAIALVLAGASLGVSAAAVLLALAARRLSRRALVWPEPGVKYQFRPGESGGWFSLTDGAVDPPPVEAGGITWVGPSEQNT